MSNLVPDDWNINQLSDLVDVRSSNVDKKSYDGHTPVRLCNYTDVYYNSKIKNNFDFMVATAKEKEIERFTLEVDDVIITKDSETPSDIAVPAYVSEELTNVVCGYHLSLLRPFKEKSNGQFLSHLFQLPSVQHHFYILANGITRFGLTADAINNAPLPTPPLPEQQKIAAILSSVDEVIEKTQAQIKKLKDLKTGMMQELLSPREPKAGDQTGAQASKTNGLHHTEFKDSPLGRIPVGWEVKHLEELVKPEKNITYGIVQAGPHCDGGVPYIRVSDMNSRHLNLNGMLLTSQAIAEKYKRSAVSTGDIVYALRGMIGHVLPVPSDLHNANLTQGTARISPNEKINSDYLLWALRSPYVDFQNDLEAKGSTFREVTLASLRKILICVPPINEQIKLSHTLNAIESKMFIVEDKLVQLKSIKKALMQDLLTGKVRVSVN